MNAIVRIVGEAWQLYDLRLILKSVWVWVEIAQE